MSIKIIPEPDIYVTEGELQKFRREYMAVVSHMVDPPTFDEWLRERVEKQTLNNHVRATLFHLHQRLKHR